MSKPTHIVETTRQAIHQSLCFEYHLFFGHNVHHGQYHDHTSLELECIVSNENVSLYSHHKSIEMTPS